MLRIMAAFRPSALNEIGNLDSENLAIMIESMEAYVHSGGKGYLGADIHPIIRATALQEHVPSVLIGGDFGILGMASLLLIYLVPIALALGIDPAKRLDFRGSLVAYCGRFTLLVFGCMSVYMILTNGGLFLFTGKNTYLLGLDSISDFLESAVMLIVAVLCL